MRNLIYAINITLDGCCEHTKMSGSAWERVAEETLEHYTQLLQEVDLFIYGRKTYQLMVPYWPDVANNPSETKAEINFAKAFVSKNKVVFSRSLESAEDKNTRIVQGDLRDEILKLKQQPGKDLLTGGVDIPSQLVELGLVEEFRIVIVPIIAGEGRRLFDQVRLPEKLQLKLGESKLFNAAGAGALRYAKQ